MFTINVEGQPGAPADTSLLVLPTVPKIQEGAPTEDVMLVRDEVANMVWGVENVIPLASGDSKPGTSAPQMSVPGSTTYLNHSLVANHRARAERCANPKT